MKEQTVSGVHQLCMMAMMSAVMCVIAPLSIPIGSVPISAATLVIYLSVYLLGTKMGTVSCAVYLMLGFAGLPVFSNYTGGAAKLLGPTGGYLAGYIFLALVCGLFMEKSSYKMIWCIIGMIAGTAVLYVFGTVWFVIMMKCDIGYAVSACVTPFIIGDLAKIIFSELAGREIRKRLKIAGLI